MKYKVQYFLIVSLLVLASCGKDNYDAPGSDLTGTIVYNGQGVQVRGTGEAVRLYLYEDGWQLRNPIEVFVSQDGTFSAKLFDGTYKMVTRDNNGPWVNTRDTTVVNVKGRTSVELSVTPYFTVSGATMNLSGSTVSASFTINKIVSDAEIDRVYLVLSKTQFVDEVNNVFRQDITDAQAGSNSRTIDFSGSNDAVKAKFLFGRVGVKSNRTGEAIWSPVMQLK